MSKRINAHETGYNSSGATLRSTFIRRRIPRDMSDPNSTEIAKSKKRYTPHDDCTGEGNNHARAQSRPKRVEPTGTSQLALVRPERRDQGWDYDGGHRHRLSRGRSRVGASKGESGSPVRVDARPVGVAVTSTTLSTISDAAQPLEKPAQYICRRTRRGVSISPP